MSSVLTNGLVPSFWEWDPVREMSLYSSLLCLTYSHWSLVMIQSPATCWSHSIGIPTFLNHKSNRLLWLKIFPVCSIVLGQQKANQDTDLIQYSYRHFLLLLDPVGRRVDCKGREGKGNEDSLFAWSKSILAVNAVFGKYPNATLVRSEVMDCLDCHRDHPLHVFRVGIGLRTSKASRWQQHS